MFSEMKVRRLRPDTMFEVLSGEGAQIVAVAPQALRHCESGNIAPAGRAARARAHDLRYGVATVIRLRFLSLS